MSQPVDPAAQRLVQEHLAQLHHAGNDTHTPAEKLALRERIKALLKAQDAVLVAHYYTDPELQSLAE